jgi:hypothetical protein
MFGEVFQVLELLGEAAEVNTKFLFTNEAVALGHQRFPERYV